MSRTWTWKGWLAVMMIVAALSVIGGAVAMLVVRMGAPGPIAVLDDHGSCWIGTHGKIHAGRVVLEANGGALVFHRPVVAFSFAEHVSQATVSRLLRVDMRHCMRVLKSD